ncbi:MAG: DUF1295 domain-containing protein [Streptosporangiaceae bacterium]|jgi:steroid 5-alpha reductase family enzyme
MASGTLAAFGLTLLLTAAAVTALLLATFAIALTAGRFNVVDVSWGLGFAVAAVVALAASAGHGAGLRRDLLAAATVVWGLRLAAYIGWRSRGQGEDPRYAEMLSKAPPGRRATYALRKVFLAQAGLIWLISVPVQAGMFERGAPPALIWIGLAIWLCGLAFESAGDWQLARFKADPANRGQVMDRGLWHYTRHPNYFGDACVWWGLFLISCGSWIGLATVFSPILMTFLLAGGSGKPITEGRMAERPGYREYVARTSGFFPLPPRR